LLGENKMAKKRKYKRKTWCQKHWDEVMLYGGIIVGIYLLLSGMGAI